MDELEKQEEEFYEALFKYWAKGRVPINTLFIDENSKLKVFLAEC